MPTSLVTGAAGFIGSHVVDNVLMMGHDVVALDDLSGGFEENINPKAEFIKGSVEDYELVQEIFERYRFDYVYHLAAYAAEGLSHFIKRFNYTNNLLGSINLINASINSGTVKTFVFTSSIAVYGRNQLPMTEELTPNPEDPYGIAKYAVELDLKESHEMFGLNYIIFRPHNVYGERQNISDKYRNVIGIFMNQILQKKPMTIFGDGEQTRAFSYIGDVAPIIAGSVERNAAYNQVYNIGADTPYSINHLSREVARAMKAEVKIKYLDARNEVVHAYSTHTKASSHFGDLIKNVTLEDGLNRMALWAKNHVSRKTTTFNNIEVTKNLPESWR
ncbi:MAG: UDP-glucose 4-epimerase [Planctomycetes bacterium RIFCSPHIGHO2_02_FULL_40_12]|nr:MAG: UDP-glucose 4-epimerase [Planctomycetes bacterium RIFCSPHIGHO2_02_FULL_40_12]